MASFNYTNNTAPFWDFVASREQQGNSHPFFGQNFQDRNGENEHGEDQVGQPPLTFSPWSSFSHGLFGGPGGLPHRGPPPSTGPHGRPPPGPHGPPTHHDEHSSNHERDGEKDADKSDNGNGNGNDNDNGEGPAGSGSDGEEGRRYGRGRHGHCGARRGRRGFGGRGGFGPYHGGPGSHRHRGPPPHPEGPRSGPNGHGHGCGPCGYNGLGGSPFWGGWNAPFGNPCSFGSAKDFRPYSNWAPFFDAFVSQHPSGRNNEGRTEDNEDFTPEADIFDTSSAYIIHVSLPGAKKEDVGVNWDAEKSELSVAGVIYRPGDEEFLKTLATNERTVGPFERKIRLGTRAKPAHVDPDGITAKLEDGVLRIEVRKEEEGFVEIRKVDVQ
ncbi:hypothetical protein SVAN01_05990 [Stagonosporopsis vannaccii]|nr:hypothetical protein SVAN01_05990 [Stagonosporopsis vannaccii]